MSAWAGVDLALIREAAENRDGLVQLELDRNLFGGQALIRVTVSDPMNPRRKPKQLFPGPLVGDDHAQLLRAIADVLDGSIDSLVVTDPRDEGIVRCRECGCTDEDCSECIATTGQPCAWVEPWQAGVPNLCTRCAS